MQSGFSFLGSAALIFMLVSACKTTELAAQSTKPADKPAVKAVANKPTGQRQVMSVFLNAVAGKNQEVQFSVQKVIMANGYFKNNSAGDSFEPGNFKGRFTDDNGNGLDSSYFENPLKRPVEYVKDDGKLAHGTIDNDKETAFVRANYNAAITKVQVYNSSNKLIKTLDLKEYINK